MAYTKWEAKVPAPVGSSNIRTFDTGATRDTAEGKLSYHRFLSARVLKGYCEYLDKHRVQADGGLREPDNWKKGIEIPVYADSLFRHGIGEAMVQYEATGKVDRDTLHAIMFNVMGWLYEDGR